MRLSKDDGSLRNGKEQEEEIGGDDFSPIKEKGLGVNRA